MALIFQTTCKINIYFSLSIIEKNVLPNLPLYRDLNIFHSCAQFNIRYVSPGNNYSGISYIGEKDMSKSRIMPCGRKLLVLQEEFADTKEVIRIR